MILGILSDTHDRYEITGTAVRTLKERGAKFLIHCGDVCEPRILDHLAGLPCAFVWGNCDWDRAALQRYGESIDVPCRGAIADLEFDAKRVAALHGDDARLLDATIKGQQYDYLFHGHTHVKRDERFGRTRVINPGALHRAAVKTVALLDTATDALEFIRIA
jgi:uncharacterized protein